MQTVADAGLAVEPEVFAANTLELVVPAGNPAGTSRGLADLADPELTRRAVRPDGAVRRGMPRSCSHTAGRDGRRSTPSKRT